MQTNARTRVIRVSLSISRDEILKLYQGVASEVSATSVDGLRLRFPASSLRPFVTHEGVQGSFDLRVDQQNKLLEIVRRM